MALYNNKKYNLHFFIFSILIITILSGIIRGYKLDSAPYIQDEFYTAEESEIRRHRYLNPAYYHLAHQSSKIFGNNEFAYRFPSYIFGVLSIPLFFFCFRPFMGNNAALFGAILLALNSWHIYHSANARFYAAIAFFSIMSTSFYIQSILNSNIYFLIIHLFSALISLLFHATSLAFSASFWIISLFIYFFLNEDHVVKSQKRIAFIHFCTGLILLCLALPAALHLLTHWQSSGQTWGRSGIGLILQSTNKIGPTVTIAAAAGLVIILRDKFVLAIIFGISTAVSMGLFFVLSFFMPVRPDYFISILPITVALTGYFCSSLNSYWKVIQQYGILAIIIVSFIPGTISHCSHLNTYSVKNIVSYLDDEFKSGDSIINFVDGLRFYSSIDHKFFDQFPSSPYSNSYNWAQLLQSHSNNRRTWVVVPIRRRDISNNLFSYLTCSGKLLWRDIAKRYDYSDFGAEIYLIDWSDPKAKACLQ